LASPTGLCHAQDEDELGVTAQIERPMARTGGDDPTASATEIDARNRPTPLDSLADALLEAPGARPLRTGGVGSPATVSLRGSNADQVEVLFGDIPLASADGSSFDLTSIPLWALERVEVYRGGAPTWLARSGIGGLVRLVPRAPARSAGFSATGAVGSFGLGHARLAQAASVDDVEWMVSAGATTAQNDFPFLADVTLLDGSDDAVERTRANAWTTQGAGFAHLRIRAGDGHLSALVLGRGRVGGVPGRAAQPTSESRRTEGELIGGVAWSITDNGEPAAEADWRFAASASVGVRERSLFDPLSEIGLVPVDATDLAVRATARAAAAGRALPWLELTGVALYVHETLAPTDRLARTPNRESGRDEGNFGFEARLFGRADDVRLELRPSVRVALVDARLHDLRPGLGGASTDAFTAAPTFRIGAALEPIAGVTIAASASSATRVPNQVELFGDRSFLVGVASLRPERAETFDVGLVVAGREATVRGRAELRGFVTLASDLIRYRRYSLFQAIPENVGSATLAGAELGLRGSITRHFSLSSAWTLLGTWSPNAGRDRQLPLRPWLTGYVRPEVRAYGVGPLDRVGVFADLVYVSESFWDPANTASIPARSRVGLGVSMAVWEERLQVQLTLRDIFDQRGFDLLGFPLPGRSLAVSLALRSD